MSGTGGNERIPEELLRIARTDKSPETLPDLELAQLFDQVSIIGGHNEMAVESLAAKQKPDPDHFRRIRDAANRALVILNAPEE